MSYFNQLHISALMGACWNDFSEQTSATTKQMAWLMDNKSLTERLRAHCDELFVDVLGIYDVKKNVLSSKEIQLLGLQNCLVREVILSGDHVPWVCARTLIPNSTLTGQEKDIANIGAMPLGQRLFSDKSTRRDAIETACIKVDEQYLWARRSRLWTNDKPLLVSELFLPQAPIYQKDY